jgi:hypothetical protein
LRLAVPERERAAALVLHADVRQSREDARHVRPSPGRLVQQPFRVDVRPAVLDDLAERLARTRLPDGLVLDGGEDEARLERIGLLFERWRDDYDWRAVEARINEHEQLLVDGLHVLRAGTRGAPPLLLMNGWPSTFAEYLPALPLLADFEVAIVSRAG